MSGASLPPVSAPGGSSGMPDEKVSFWKRFTRRYRVNWGIIRDPRVSGTDRARSLWAISWPSLLVMLICQWAFGNALIIPWFALKLVWWCVSHLWSWSQRPGQAAYHPFLASHHSYGIMSGWFYLLWHGAGVILLLAALALLAWALVSWRRRRPGTRPKHKLMRWVLLLFLLAQLFVGAPLRAVGYTRVYQELCQPKGISATSEGLRRCASLYQRWGTADSAGNMQDPAGKHKSELVHPLAHKMASAERSDPGNYLPVMAICLIPVAFLVGGSVRYYRRPSTPRRRPTPVGGP